VGLNEPILNFLKLVVPVSACEGSREHGPLSPMCFWQARHRLVGIPLLPRNQSCAMAECLEANLDAHIWKTVWKAKRV